jgi:hypothetical protein
VLRRRRASPQNRWNERSGPGLRMRSRRRYIAFASEWRGRPSTGSARAKAPERHVKPPRSAAPKTPVDRRGEPDHAMSYIHDPIEPRPKQILPHRVLQLLRPHRESPSSSSIKGENRSAAAGSICKRTAPKIGEANAKDYFAFANIAARSKPSVFFTGD